MAHFAKIDNNNKVVQVIVVSNDDCLDENGNESEEVGVAFCNKLIKGRWIQTSYNGNIRKRYAGIGMTYNEEYDVFHGDSLYPSWSLNSEGDWCPPVPYPTDGKEYGWDEENQTWIERT